MKKYLYISAIAAMALTGCANDDFIGDIPGNDPSAVKAKEISFGGETGKISRADAGTAKGTEKDAGKLSNRFWVYGVKHTSNAETTEETTGSTTNQVVYNNYLVKYMTASATTTTKTWEYNTLNNSSDAKDEGTEGNYNYTTAIDAAYKGNQGTKYWDYSADKGYTFTAFSANPADLDGNSPNIKIKKDGDVYKLTMATGTKTDQLYFADKVDVAKDNYGKSVLFTFRNVLAKVRVGMYSTIPGYSVKIDKFYSGTNQEDESTDKFKANVTNTPFSADGKTEYTISYATDNHAKLTAPTTTASSAGGNAKTRVEGEENTGTTSTTQKSVIELGTNITSTDKLSTDKSQPTYDTTNGAYTTFIAQKDNTSDMNIKVDYTLTSTDGSNETIVVRGATVTVKAENLKWETNHAYTYIFKLSDQTNGNTGTDTDKAGLFPITFDAVVAEEGSGTDINDIEFNKAN